MTISNLTGIQNYLNYFMNPQGQTNFTGSYQTSLFSQPTTYNYGYNYSQPNPFGIIQSLFSIFMNPFFMMMISNMMAKAQNDAVINKEFLKINTDENEDISKEELTSYLQENFGLKEGANESLIDELIAELSTEMPEDNKINKDEFIKYIDLNQNGVFERSEINAFREKMGQKSLDINNTSEFLKINTDSDENITKEELTEYLKDNYGLSDDVDEALIQELVDEISSDSEQDGKINKNEFIKYVDADKDGKLEDSELEAFNNKLQEEAEIINNSSQFLKIDADKNESISKNELINHLENNFGLKANANTKLTDYMIEQLTEKISVDGNKEISKDEFMKYVDINSDGKLDQSEINKLNQELQLNATTLNDAKVNNSRAYIAYHGSSLTQFTSYFGSYHNITTALNNAVSQDNSSRDKDARADFISNGTLTAHKISDTKTGITLNSSSLSGAFRSQFSDCDYMVLDKTSGALIMGKDGNNDGNLTGSEIKGIINNPYFYKIASPLTFDLNGDGKVGTTGVEKEFDLDGDGKVDKTAWAAAGDGVLAFDADGDGKVGEDGKELFGNNTDIDGDGKVDGHKNGFDALKALAEKFLGKEAVADGKLDAKEIKALEEKANLTMLVDDAQKSLTELGITELSLGYEESDKVDENGNEHRQVGEGFVINGEKAKVNDVWFKYIQG